MLEILPVNDKNILAFKATVKLTDADYRQFLSTLEETIRRTGKLSLYIELQAFKSWDAQAAWDDFRFGQQHDRDFKRIAIIADKPLVHAAIGFANFFSHSEIRFFDKSESDTAWNWLREKSSASKSSKSIQPYKNILLPTDFSVHSNSAAERALQIAGQYGAKLHVLHVVEDFIYYTEDYDPVVADISQINDTLMAQADQNMSKFIDRNSLGKDAELEIQWGTPKRSIITWACEKNIDLIVMEIGRAHV